MPECSRREIELRRNRVHQKEKCRDYVTCQENHDEAGMPAATDHPILNRAERFALPYISCNLLFQINPHFLLLYLTTNFANLDSLQA